jgi:hypothetical protein
LAGGDLDDIGAAVSRGKLHKAEAVAVRVEAQRFGVDGNRAVEIRQVRQIALMETDIHRAIYTAQSLRT